MCGKLTVRRDGLGDPLADGGVRLLRLLRRGGHARANRPDRLVGDDDLGGVKVRDARLQLLNAVRQHGIVTLLADGEGLADGEDDVDALGDQVGHLGREELARLGRRGQAKLAAALGVADEAPLDVHRGHLVSRHLTSEGAATLWKRQERESGSERGGEGSLKLAPWAERERGGEGRAGQP